MARVIFAQIRLPLFSIKFPEAFQVMSALPIPQPSSLIGALAYCLGVTRHIGTRAYEEVLGMVRDGRIMAARACPLGIANLDKGTAPLTLSAIVLRRFRIADKAHETKKKGEIKPITRLVRAVQRNAPHEVKRIVEIELTDALYREYVMGFDLLAAWVIRDDVDIDPKELWLIPRLGDTESLCSVTKVWSEEAELLRTTTVKTPFPAPAEDALKISKGSFMIAKICDESRNLRPFIIPCEIKVERGKYGKYTAILPSSVAIEYKREVKVCATSKGSIVLKERPLSKGGSRR